MANSKRVFYLDFIRSFAIIMVLVLHSISNFISNPQIYGQPSWYIYLVLNAFTRTGFAFAGWAQSADADKASYADGAEVLNLADTANATVALYAVWEASRYYVAFAANGGKGTMNAQNATYGVETDLETNAFGSALRSPRSKMFRASV